MLSSWIPYRGAVLRDIANQDGRDGVYLAEFFRRRGHLAQVCQAGIHERVGEDVYVG